MTALSLDLWLPALLSLEAPRRLRAVPAPAPASDEALVARIAGGDRGAFDELFERHADVVYRRISRLVGPDPEREDLVQEVFVTAYRQAPRFRNEARFSTWLHRVVVNVAYDHLRRRKRRPITVPAETAELVTETNPEGEASTRQQLALAMTLLDRLPPKKRIAFVLRVVEGLSLAEIGALVGAQPAAVGARVRSAQDELEAMLERRRRREAPP